MLRIGKFGFINNFLAYYKLEKEGKYEIVKADPKALAELFEKNYVDYAPVPSYYYLKKKPKRHKFCVASNGEVYSVIVISKGKKLGEKIAATSKSMTSVNMLRIIVKERGLKSEVVQVSGSYREILKDYESALLIGDEAIKARMVYRVAMDLGEEWKDLTGLPAVFGVAVSNGAGEKIDEDVLNSVRWGRENIDVVVEEASKKFRLPEEFLETYFEALIHEMGRKEERGLREYEELCKAHGLL
ncbi:protein of unknown function DUF178 [Ferroglobus placidus DSM 10642]|uniref:Chorismate dehydratase n=1 Tax=Ferroglobus placidus (strain DSM 10642 / AEDII12DO) TaxID=589924 RepID=D3RZX0_FERPA|nr:menaquinone biosynthesis protein [Ferroglobus placidus]ADC66033.1 protein of unknown function DUF178 [Ferroglobus placidus DSM 10642]